MNADDAGTAAAANDELVRELIRVVWNGRQTERLPDFWTGPSAQEARHLHGSLVEAFPDLRITVADTVADARKVAARLTFRGTHRGPFRDVAPTGRAVEFAAIRVYEIADGKIIGSWAVVDVLSLLDQLGDDEP